MESSEKESFKRFARYYWRENCTERSDWGEDQLAFEVFVENNRGWLEQQFKKEQLEKREYQ